MAVLGLFIAFWLTNCSMKYFVLGLPLSRDDGLSVPLGSKVNDSKSNRMTPRSALTILHRRCLGCSGPVAKMCKYIMACPSPGRVENQTFVNA